MAKKRKCCSCCASSIRDCLEHVLGVGFVSEVRTLWCLLPLSLVVSVATAYLVYQLRLVENVVIEGSVTGNLGKILGSNAAIDVPAGDQSRLVSSADR